MVLSLTLCLGRLQRGNVLRNSLVHYMYIWLIFSVVTASTPFTPLVINPRFSHTESPKIGVDYKLPMLNSHCLLNPFTEHSS